MNYEAINEQKFHYVAPLSNLKKMYSLNYDYSTVHKIPLSRALLMCLNYE